MGYLMAAYSLVWIIMFAYILILGKRHAKLLKEIEFLKQFDQ